MSVIENKGISNLLRVAGVVGQGSQKVGRIELSLLYVVGTNVVKQGIFPQELIWSQPSEVLEEGLYLFLILLTAERGLLRGKLFVFEGPSLLRLFIDGFDILGKSVEFVAVV